MKTEIILSAYKLLNTAKITNMSDEDKVKIIKAVRKMKPVFTEFEDAQKDALEQAKGEDHDEFIRKAQQWQVEGENTTLTEEERIEINRYFNNYNKVVTSSINDLINKDVELGIEKLTEEGFSKLLTSNDWTVDQSMVVEDVLVG